MPLNKEDAQIEELMNQKGMTHKEAMAEVSKKKSEEDDEEEDEGSDMEGISLPTNLLPDVPVGKEIDVSICGIVQGVQGDMVKIKTKNFSVRISEPYKPNEVAKATRDY